MIVESKVDFQKKLDKLKHFKILGIDYGYKKTGLAIYNSLVNISLPFKMISRVNDNMNELYTIIDDKLINGIIIGLPLKLDGKEPDNIDVINEFARKLSDQTKLPIFFSDERFTTNYSHALLKEYGMKRKKREEVDDMLSAVIILQNFFVKPSFFN